MGDDSEDQFSLPRVATWEIPSRGDLCSSFSLSPPPKKKKKNPCQKLVWLLSASLKRRRWKARRK